MDGFTRLGENDWERQVSPGWTARECLAHVVSTQEEEGNRLAAQALAGKAGELPGFVGRGHQAAYNEAILAPLRGMGTSQLLDRLEASIEEHLAALSALTETDLGREASNPRWDRSGRLIDIFYMSYLHLPLHYQDIRRAAKKKLPHWIKACDPEELAFFMDRTFGYMPLIYWPSRGKDHHASVRFRIDGAGGGSWRLKIADGRVETCDDDGGKVDLEIRTKAAVWMDLSTKDLNPIQAVLTKKLQVSGNFMLAMALDSLFEVS